MSSKPVLAVFLLATIGVAGGSAWAAMETTPDYAQQATVIRDYGKLSTAGARGFSELRLARLAIYDGQTAKAKTFADEADQLFDKAKTDNTAFVKAHSDLVTADQLAARKPDAKPEDGKTATTASDEKIAWLPIGGSMNIDRDYVLSPTKVKAIGEANKSLQKGDRNGAIDQLRFAGIDTSIVMEVVPLDQTIADAHQAAQLIDAGKYYEGSQMLRKVEVAARFDVTNLVATPKAAAAPSSTATGAPKAN